jgi:hypothetical protein
MPRPREHSDDDPSGRYVHARRNRPRRDPGQSVNEGLHVRLHRDCTDAYIAGCVTTYLSGRGALDPQRRQILTDCATELSAVLPVLPECDARYVARLIQIANLVTSQT